MVALKRTTLEAVIMVLVLLSALASAQNLVAIVNTEAAAHAPSARYIKQGRAITDNYFAAHDEFEALELWACVRGDVSAPQTRDRNRLDAIDRGQEQKSGTDPIVSEPPVVHRPRGILI